MSTLSDDALHDYHAESGTDQLQFYLEEGAIMPTRAHDTDAGYDLTLIRKVSDIELTSINFPYGQITYASMYTTGIRVRPPPFFHTELVGRSSIAKTGHMLANNIGIIDSDYRGEILVCLIKSPDAPPLPLPAKIVQLIPRKTHNLSAVSVSKNAFFSNSTKRGDGGFGSTDLNH